MCKIAKQNQILENIYNFDGNYSDYTSYIVNDHSKQSTNKENKSGGER